jgi:hypothetical protein
MYKRAMGGSLEDLTSLAEIDPGDPQYNSQIGRVFDVLLYRMNLSFQSPTTQIELFSLSTAYCCCLMNLRPSGDEVPDGLSKGFTRVWPAIWKVFGSTFVPSVTRHTVNAEGCRFANRLIVDVCRVLGLDNITMLQMITTPGFSSVVLEIWSMEVEHSDYQPWHDEDGSSMSGFLDRMLIFINNQDDKHMLEQFLAPTNADMKFLASTALKHHRHSFYQTQPDWDCVIWNTHIITVLSGIHDPLRHAFLAQHSIPAITKLLVTLTAETPLSATALLKGKVISYSLWNLIQSVDTTDGVTWVIQALEAKLMLALVRCECWLPFLHDDPEDFFYPFLNKILPNYSAYRSVLCIIDKYMGKIQQLGLDAGKSQDTPLWKAWNCFVELVESRMEVLQLAPGGLLRAHERCQNAAVSLINFRSLESTI